MFEPLKKLMSLSQAIKRILAQLVHDRVIYAGLAVCHAMGCVITDKPQLYGPMAVLYAILALRA